MKSDRMRKLAALFMLASAATQPALGCVLLASALTLWPHGSSHAHAVSVVAEEGHLHLVLSHAEEAPRDHGRAPKHGGASFAEPDHVFHVAGDDAEGATLRRAAADPAPALAVAVALPRVPAPARPLRPSPEPRARSSDLLRTVVLRL